MNLPEQVVGYAQSGLRDQQLQTLLAQNRHKTISCKLCNCFY